MTEKSKDQSIGWPLGSMPFGGQAAAGINSGQKRVRNREIIRTFWHGDPLDPYGIECLRSFVTNGYGVEMFVYDSSLALPSWIVRRDANEIWPTDRVWRYQARDGLGSPALHANLFRYALLYRLGGWWVDADVMLLRPQLPNGEYFLAYEDDYNFNCAIMKFPVGHPLLADAIKQCEAIGETAFFGQTGPRLLTELVRKYGLSRYGYEDFVTCPVRWWDIEALFDPSRCDEILARVAHATFLHLCKETWRRSGISSALAPPEGSFLDRIGADQFAERMDFSALSKRFMQAMRADFMQRLVSLEMTLDERSSRLESLEQALEERTNRLAALEVTLVERDERLKTIERDRSDLAQKNR